MLSCVVLLCSVMLCCCLLSFVSWVDFWLFWGCLGSIFGRFGGSWGVFWRSWRVLGGSWEALEGSWAPLEAVLGRYGSSKVILELARWAEPRHLGPPRRVKMRQKSDPEGIKIDDKNEVEKRCS